VGKDLSEDGELLKREKVECDEMRNGKKNKTCIGVVRS